MISSNWISEARRLVKVRNDFEVKPFERLLPSHLSLWKTQQHMDLFLGELKVSFQALQFETARASAAAAEAVSSTTVNCEEESGGGGGGGGGQTSASGSSTGGSVASDFGKMSTRNKIPTSSSLSSSSTPTPTAMAAVEATKSLSTRLLSLQSEIRDKFKQERGDRSRLDDLIGKARIHQRRVSELEEEQQMLRTHLRRAQEQITLQQEQIWELKADRSVVAAELDACRASREQAETRAQLAEHDSAMILKDLLQSKSNAAQQMNDMNAMLEKAQMQVSAIQTQAQVQAHAHARAQNDGVGMGVGIDIGGGISGFFRSFTTSATGTDTSTGTGTGTGTRDDPAATAVGCAGVSVGSIPSWDNDEISPSVLPPSSSHSHSQPLVPSRVRRSFQAHKSEINDMSLISYNASSIHAAAIATTTDADCLLTASADGSIKLYVLGSTGTGTGAEETYSFECGGPVLACALMSATSAIVSANAHLLIMGSNAMGCCKLWSWSGGGGGGEGPLQTSSTSTSRSSSSNNNNSYYRTSRATLLNTLTMPSHKVASCVLLRSATRALTGGADRTIRLWELNSYINEGQMRTSSSSSSSSSKEAHCLGQIKVGSSINYLSVAPDESTVASAHADGTVRFFSTDNTNTVPLKAITTIGLHSAAVTCVRYHPQNSDILISCGRDSIVHLIDMKKMASVATMRAPDLRIAGESAQVVFSPDGAYIAAGSANGCIFVFSSVDGSLRTTLQPITGTGTGAGISAISWGSMGLMSADKTGRVVMWQ